MKIALVTGRAARRLVEELVAGISGVVIVELPVNVMSFLSAHAIASILKSRRDLLDAAREADVIIVPGTVSGDVRVISEVVGKPVYKGTRTTAGIPFIIKHLREGGALHTVRPAEDVIGSSPTLPEPDAAFEISGVKIPRRGPPLVLASEIPPEVPADLVTAEAARIAEQGARIVIVGATHRMSPEQLAARVESVANVLSGEAVVGAEAPTPAHARAASNAGAALLATSPATALQSTDYSDAFIIADRDVAVLSRTVNELSRVGVNRVVVDPVIDVPPLGFTGSLARFNEASSLGVPILFSAANAANEVAADSHGVHALLALVASEVGASVYLVVEDSWATRWSTSEAAEALRLAWLAWSRKTTEKGFFSRLMVVKQWREPPSIPSEGSFDVCRVEPRIDPRGYIVIGVDHKEKYIVAEWVPYEGERVRFRGRHALSLARAFVRSVGLEAEHAAYLGYELAKAELALALERTYTQDEPVVVPVWKVEWMDCSVSAGEGDTSGRALRSKGG